MLHLHGTQKNLEKFKDLVPEAKLRYLLDKQQFINKEERMRMVDITQSFNIFDSAMYKETKTVEEKLETNKDYNLKTSGK